MTCPLADVAELADAQVSEACDGDIVEVQVLSSAPGYPKNWTSSARLFSLYVPSSTWPEKVVTKPQLPVFRL